MQIKEDWEQHAIKEVLKIKLRPFMNQHPEMLRYFTNKRLIYSYLHLS